MPATEFEATSIIRTSSYAPKLAVVGIVLKISKLHLLDLLQFNQYRNP